LVTNQSCSCTDSPSHQTTEIVTIGIRRCNGYGSIIPARRCSPYRFLKASHLALHCGSRYLFCRMRSRNKCSCGMPRQFTLLDTAKVRDRRCAKTRRTCTRKGGLLMRSLIECWGKSGSVDTFISLAGIQQGFFGMPGWLQKVFGNYPAEVLTPILYNPFMQATWSMANWWHSPFDVDRRSYLDANVFLPVIQNQVKSNVNNSARFANFLRPRRMYFFGSSGDETVVPWNTELFGFWDDNLTMRPYTDFALYRDDLFGLKTRIDQGTAELIEVDGISHTGWLTNETNFVINILPLLN